jgi:hypothetical protein
MRVAVFLTALLISGSVLAHDWYPPECCSGQDCAPVLEKVRLPGGSWKITTKVGTAILPNNFTGYRPSEDIQEHACMITIRPEHWDSNGDGSMDPTTSIVCYFVAGAS